MLQGLLLAGKGKGKGSAVITGIIGLVGAFWALKKAHACRSEKEKEIYLGLFEEAQGMIQEANDELEGEQNKKFYDDPDWWKKQKGDDEDPPNPRWN
ncbi:MAG: hypothetical protein FJY98_00835 [Candidatus Liptonbacteria bacterium]|nr:hypothetical protein [Candidatus Liptonbacteria bacterium]